MAKKILKMTPDTENKLYSEYQHISSVKVPLIICAFALFGCIIGMFWFNALIFSLLGFIPIAFSIYLWFSRDFYSITNRRFIRTLGRKNIVEVPIGEVIGAEFADGEDKDKKFANLDVITTIKYGEKLLIQKDKEFGAYRCLYVSQPKDFINIIEMAKSKGKSIV